MTEQEIYEIDYRLINWARWCRDSKVRYTCRSIEHRYNYRSDAMNGEEVIVGEPTHAFAGVDHADAVLINKAWQQLPELNNKLIAAHYIPRMREYKATCKRLGLRISEYDANLLKSQRMVKNLLAFIFKA